MTIEVDSRILLHHFHMVLNENDKLAIIGEEGNGKSTLLKCILGICDYAEVTGSIDTNGYHLGYLKQQLTSEELNQSVQDYLFQTSEIYYDKINLFYQCIKKLRIPDTILEVEQVSYLSGGEKVKLQLLKLLLDEPDILLLDEPTNDLDIKTLEWLENFICTTSKPIIYVSHDETLLSRTANRILHLELVHKKQVAKYTLRKTDYDNYVHSRLKLLEKTRQIAKKERQEKARQEDKLRQIYQRVEHEQEHISRNNPHGAKMLKRKMKSVKAQEKRMEQQELTEIPDSEEAIFFCFEGISLPSKKELLNLEIPLLKIGEKVLARHIALTVQGNEHIVIIGDNGVGKSTLIKHIYQILKTRNDIHLGYMPQDYDSVLQEYKTAVQFLNPSGNREETNRVRSYLGNMKFTSEEMVMPLKELSGGSKAKLLLLKLVLDKCNVLLLDEPTRNVSPLSNPIIREVLRNFRGAIISVSHDRKYMDEVCDKVYELTIDGLNQII